jgi:hypothetical protein
MMHCHSCGLTAPSEDFAVMEDGAKLAEECPRCASPEVFAFDPDGD